MSLTESSLKDRQQAIEKWQWLTSNGQVEAAEALLAIINSQNLRLTWPDSPRRCHSCGGINQHDIGCSVGK
jgi:hypothetical protein